MSSNFRRINHTYENLTHAQTSEKQVAPRIVPSCVEQRWKSLKDLVVFEATTFIKMSGRLLLERCWSAWENLTMMLINTLWEIFCMFNFRSLRRVQKLANYENFSIYGSKWCHRPVWRSWCCMSNSSEGRSVHNWKSWQLGPQYYIHLSSDSISWHSIVADPAHHRQDHRCGGIHQHPTN